MCEQHRLGSKLNEVYSQQKRLKTNFKGKIEKFVASYSAFSFISLVKGTLSYWKQFLYVVLAVVKQLGIPTCK